MRSTLFVLSIALGIGALGQDGSAPSDPKQSGPTGLVVQYSCTPAQRPALRKYMLDTGLRRFEGLRQQGVVEQYRVLFSRYADTDTWDMLALFTFSNYSNAIAWKRVERSNPGGLDANAAAMLVAIHTYPVDRMRGAANDAASPEPVYLVVPYTTSVSTPAYLQYADDYVIPQFEGWLREGVLASYELYLQRYTAARPWDSLILLRYKDDESLGARERVVAKVRQQLQSNPKWRAISENKQSVRVEKVAVVAEELAIRR